MFDIKKLFGLSTPKKTVNRKNTSRAGGQQTRQNTAQRPAPAPQRPQRPQRPQKSEPRFGYDENEESRPSAQPLSPSSIEGVDREKSENIFDTAPRQKNIHKRSTPVSTSNMALVLSERKLHQSRYFSHDVILATPEDEEEILKYEGEVLTAEGSRFKLSQRHRDVAAFFSDGTFLILSQDLTTAQNAFLSEVYQAATRNMQAVNKVYEVQPHILEAVHENYRQRNSSLLPMVRTGGLVQNALKANQIEFIKWVREAKAQRASDIHVYIDKSANETRVDIRTNGIIKNLRRNEPVEDMLNIVAAAYNMCDQTNGSYQLYEIQDGRISRLSTKDLPEGVDGLRLHYNPMGNGGRHLVARLLDKPEAGSEKRDVDTLGYSKRQVALIKRMRRNPIGVNIISGGTGSGKSRTLQYCLNSIMHESNNEVVIFTVEDPPEYKINNAAQIPVKDGDYDKTIAAALRSDPDIILVGEIRTEESAGLAFEAAMTGHQVWASLHANDAISIISRLKNKGVDIYNLTNHRLMTGCISQKLVEVVCPHCSLTHHEMVERGALSDVYLKEMERITKGEYYDGMRYKNPKGCSHCKHSGVKGRTVVAEMLIPDKIFMKLIRNNDIDGAYDYWYDNMEGFSLYDHAVQKSLTGICDPEVLHGEVGVIEEYTHKRLKLVMSDVFLEKE